MAKFVKPIVDGTVASFHDHGGGSSNQKEIAKRMVEYYLGPLDISPSDIEVLLNKHEEALLGQTHLFQLSKTGRIQLSPKDHKYVACEVTTKSSNENFVTISGELFEVRRIVQ